MIKRILNHRYLLIQFSKRQIEQRHKGSILGGLWLFVLPLIMMSIYTIVFGLIFEGRYSGVDNQSTLTYALGVFLSLTIFHVVADVASVSTTLISGQPNLVKKIVFPLEILPISGLAYALFQFFVSFSLFSIAIMTVGEGFGNKSIFFVVVIAPLAPLCIGIAFFLSSIGVFFRDIQQIVGPLTMILLYSSAVFYSVDMVPESIWAYLRFNPVLFIVDGVRSTLLWNENPNWKGIGYCYVFSLGVLGLGLVTFRKLKVAFSDAL